VSTYPTPALDFMRKVQVWQQAPGGTAGIAVFMPDREETTLDGLLAQADRAAGANLAVLETSARTWLIGYREMNPPLSAEQAAELDAVIARTAAYPDWARPPRQPRPRRKPLSRRALVVILSAAFAVGIGGAGILHATLSGNGSPPPPAVFQPAAAPPQAPPAADTQLQQLRADWGIPDIAQPAAGNPHALVLLDNGLYYPSPWTVPANDPGWGPDTGGHVATITNVTAGRITFTDGNGISWTVGAGQPFTEASDPGTVLEFDPGGNVLSMHEDHAIVIRRRA
jgi:hypothetical protein